MDPEETGEIVNTGMASIQERSAKVQVENSAEISIAGTHAVPDAATSPRITATLQSTAASNEDTINSESTFDTTPENATTYHPSPNTIPQNHISTTLENNIAALGETATTVNPGDKVAFRNNHISTSKETNKSVSGDTVVSCWEASTISKDFTLNTPRNNNSTASGNAPKKGYLISTNSGDNTTSTIEETTTVLGNIITSTTGDTFYKASRNMATDESNKYNLSGETTTILSTGDVGKTTIPREKATIDFENSTLTRSSMNALENTSATGYTAVTGSGDNTAREDTTTAPPGNVNQTELTVSAGKDTNIISREILNTTLKKTYGDTITTTSFRDSPANPISVGTKTTEGNTFTNIVGNVTDNCESTIVSEGAVSTTSVKNAALRHNTIDGFGNNAISGTIYKEINQFLFDGGRGTITAASGETFAASQDTTLNVPGYFTTTTSSQDTTGYSAKIEPGRSSETITGETTIAFENATITHGDIATSDVTHMIPTNIAVTEAAREATARNTTTILENGNTTASRRSAPAPQNTGGTTSEDIIATTTSKDAIESMASRETSTINFEEVATPTTSTAFENTTIISLAPGETTFSAGDVMNIASGNGTTSATGKLSTTVPTETPIVLGKATTHSERSSTNFTSEDSKITVDSGDPTDCNITISTNPSEIVTSSKYANDTMTSAYGVTATTVTTPLGKMGRFRESHTLPGTAASAVTMRIHASTNNGGSTLLEELITPDLSPSLPIDVRPVTFTSSRGKPVLESTSTHGDTHDESVSPDITSTHDTAQDRKMPRDSKMPSDTITVVPGASTPNTGPAPYISLLLREISTDAVEEVTTNTVGSVFTNATNTGTASVDTPEEMHYVKGITSVHSGTPTFLRQIPTPKHLFSIGTGTQGASTSPGDTTTAFAYTTNISEGATLEETFSSVHSEITTTLEQESNFNKTTSSGCTTAGVSMLSERSLAEYATSSSGDSNIWSDVPMVIGTKNVASCRDTTPLCRSVTTDSSATSVTLMTSEAISTPEDARHTTDTRVYSVFATGDTIITATSVGSNIPPTNKPSESPTDNALEDFVKTTTLLEDTFTITATAATAMSTITALRDTVMATQAFPGDITTVSKDKSANTLQDSPKLGKTATSENILTTGLGDTRSHSEVLTPGTRASSETQNLEDTSDPVANITLKENLSHYTSTVTANAPATASTINTLSDSISTPDNATSVFKITTRAEGILTSRNISTATSVGINIQDQTTITESPNIVPGKFSLATGENATTIISEAQIVTGDNTVANMLDGVVTNVTFTSSSENVTNITGTGVSPRDPNAAANVPWDATTLPLVPGETMPPGETLSSGNAISVTTALGEGSACSDSCSTAEAFSTLTSSLHGDTGHLLSLSLDNISTLGDASRIPGASISFGNSISPTLFVEGTDLSIDTGDTTIPRATTSILTSADLSIIAIAPGATTIPIPERTGTNDSRWTIASSAPEHNPTTYEATDDSTTGLPSAKYIIASIMSSGDITATVSGDATTTPGDNTTSISAPRGTNITTALGNIHSTSVTACGDVIGTVGDNTSPEKRVIPRKASSFIHEDTSSTHYEASTPNHARTCGETSASESTCMPVANLATRGTFGRDFSIAVFNSGTAEITNTINDTTTAYCENAVSAPGGIVSVSEGLSISGGTVTSTQITTAILEDARKQNKTSTSGAAIPLAETPITKVNSISEMNLREVANTTSGPTALKDARQTFAHETTSFIETPISTSAIGSTSEATIIPVETSTHGATFSFEQMSTSGNVSSIKITGTAEITSTITTTSSTSSSGNILFTPCNNSKTDEALTSGMVTTIHREASRPRANTLPRGALVFEDGAATSASGHPNTPENTTHAPENAITTVLEDTTIVFGRNSTAPDDAVTTLDLSNDSPTREISTTMGGALIANSAKRPTAKSRETTTESRVSTPREIKIVPGEVSIITSGETNTATSRKTADTSTEAPMSTGQTHARESSAATPGETDIATFGKTKEPTTIGSPMTPSETAAFSPGETFAAATFRENIDTTMGAHEHTLTAPEESLIDTPREEVFVAQPGNTTEITTRETPTAVHETTTIIHRKISATVPRKTHTTPTSGAHPAFTLDEIPTTPSVEATTTQKELLPAVPKENTPIALSPKKTTEATPRGIAPVFQGKNSTIKPVILLSYWSITLIGVTVTLVLAVGLCMVIYYVMFFILVTYAAS